MSNSQSSGTNGSTPQTNRLAAMLMGLKESDGDIAPSGNTPIQSFPMAFAMGAAPAVEPVAEACNCRKSRCLKL
jgi:hypothetical protein